MFFLRDGSGLPDAFEFPRVRFSLRVGDGPSLLGQLSHALNRHPFNQQVFLVASEGPNGPPKGARSALKEAVVKVASKSCCICLRNVGLDAFLSLPVQQLLLKRLRGSVLSWRGPCTAAYCTGGTKSHESQASCPIAGDLGGDMNVAALQNDGVMILRLDRATSHVIGLDTWMRLPHIMRKALPRGTRYLKVDVQHDAVLHHQKHRNHKQVKRQTQAKQQGREAITGCQPSRLYQRLRRTLKSLELMDLLAIVAQPEESDKGGATRVMMANDLQILLRASGSEAATCHLVQLQCRFSEYRGGVVDMTEEAALAAKLMASADVTECGGFLTTPDLPVTQRSQPLLLPDWKKLFAAAVAAERTPRTLPNADATVVVRERRLRRVGCDNALRNTHSLSEEKSGHNAGKEGESSGTSRRSSSSEPLGAPLSSGRHFPPLCSAMLGGLQLLHERRRQRLARTSEHRRKKLHAAAEMEVASDDDTLQLAAPPPFKAQPRAEAFFASVSEYLGCLSVDIPANKECSWLREADHVSDPPAVHVASVSGGLIHSAAVMSSIESLCSWLLSQRPGAWAALSVIGTAETPAAYTGQPHGSDINGESTLHLILTAEIGGMVRGMLLQTIAACDATTTLP